MTFKCVRWGADKGRGRGRNQSPVCPRGASQLGHISLRPALPRQLPQLNPLPQVGINQDFLKAIARHIKWCCFALAPAFSLIGFSPCNFYLRALPEELWHESPSWAALVSTAYSPGRWLFGSCLGTKKVLKSPQESRLDQLHPVSEPLALESAALDLWLNGTARGRLGR